jgi:hypothetical protein
LVSFLAQGRDFHAFDDSGADSQRTGV